jgi:hypothetical protein
MSTALVTSPARNSPSPRPIVVPISAVMTLSFGAVKRLGKVTGRLEPQSGRSWHLTGVSIMLV